MLTGNSGFFAVPDSIRDEEFDDLPVRLRGTGIYPVIQVAARPDVFVISAASF